MFAFLALVSLASAKWTANLGSYGTFEINAMTVSYDLKMLNQSEVYSYHIHEKWTHSAVSASGPECGATYTGGHFDPTAACGPATGQSRCIAKGGCVNKTVYTCSPSVYASDPYACEVGDLSGKYGKVTPVGTGNATATGTHTDKYMPASFDGVDRSIVFHNSDGDRVFCGKLVMEQSTPPMPGNSTSFLEANFVFGKIVITEKAVVLGADFSQVLSDPVGKSLVEPCMTGISYHIHTDWVYGASVDASILAGCGLASTGNHFDPGRACGPASGNPECKECAGAGYRCNSTRFATHQFACEAGDLSGKFGKVTPDTMGRIQRTHPTMPGKAMMPPLASMKGMSVVLHCGGQRVMCARLDDKSISLEDLKLPAGFPLPSLPVSSSSSTGTNGDIDTTGNPASTINPLPGMVFALFALLKLL